MSPYARTRTNKPQDSALATLIAHASILNLPSKSVLEFIASSIGERLGRVPIPHTRSPTAGPDLGKKLADAHMVVFFARNKRERERAGKQVIKLEDAVEAAVRVARHSPDELTQVHLPCVIRQPDRLPITRAKRTTRLPEQAKERSYITSSSSEVHESESERSTSKRKMSERRIRPTYKTTPATIHSDLHLHPPVLTRLPNSSIPEQATERSDTRSSSSELHKSERSTSKRRTRSTYKTTPTTRYSKLQPASPILSPASNSSPPPTVAPTPKPTLATPHNEATMIPQGAMASRARYVRKDPAEDRPTSTLLDDLHQRIERQLSLLPAVYPYISSPPHSPPTMATALPAPTPTIGALLGLNVNDWSKPYAAPAPAASASADVDMMDVDTPQSSIFDAPIPAAALTPASTRSVAFNPSDEHQHRPASAVRPSWAYTRSHADYQPGRWSDRSPARHGLVDTSGRGDATFGADVNRAARQGGCLAGDGSSSVATIRTMFARQGLGERDLYIEDFVGATTAPKNSVAAGAGAGAAVKRWASDPAAPGKRLAPLAEGTEYRSKSEKSRRSTKVARRMVEAAKKVGLHIRRHS